MTNKCVSSLTWRTHISIPEGTISTHIDLKIAEVIEETLSVPLAEKALDSFSQKHLSKTTQRKSKRIASLAEPLIRFSNIFCSDAISFPLMSYSRATFAMFKGYSRLSLMM